MIIANNVEYIQIYSKYTLQYMSQMLKLLTVVKLK